MPNGDPKIVTASDGQARVRALVAERKAALQAFNVTVDRLSQVEGQLKAIYSGSQVVNHEDLALIRAQYSKLMGECQQNLSKVSPDNKSDCEDTLEKISSKKTTLDRFWFTNCGPIADPINKMTNDLLKLMSPHLVEVSSLDAPSSPALSDYTKRQLNKCREQIQEILNKGRGEIGEEAIAKLRDDVAERYDHYKAKILEKQPEMASHLPDVQTYFAVNDKYSELLTQLSSRDTTVHVIKPPDFKPPPPPGPSPAERRQAALKEQLKQVVGTGESGPSPDDSNSFKSGS